MAKELNYDELDKVTGGTGSFEGYPPFKYELGRHVDIITSPDNSSNKTKSSTIIRRGYTVNLGEIVPVYWLDVDGKKSTWSGWYYETTIEKSNTMFQEVIGKDFTIFDQLW